MLPKIGELLQLNLNDFTLTGDYLPILSIFSVKAETMKAEGV